MSSLGGGQLPLVGFFTKTAGTATKKRPRKAEPASTTRMRTSGTAHASTSRQGQLKPTASSSSRTGLDDLKTKIVSGKKSLKTKEVGDRRRPYEPLPASKLIQFTQVPTTRTKVKGKAAAIPNPSSRPRTSATKSSVIDVTSLSPPPANKNKAKVVSDESSSSLTPLSLSPATSPQPLKKRRIRSPAREPEHLPTPSPTLPPQPESNLRTVLRFRTPPPNVFDDSSSREPDSPSPIRRKRVPERARVSRLAESPVQAIEPPGTLRSGRIYHQSSPHVKQEDSGDELLIPTSPFRQPASRRLPKRPRPDSAVEATLVSAYQGAAMPVVADRLTLSPHTATSGSPDRIPSSQIFESPLKRPLPPRTSPAKHPVHSDSIVPSSQYFEQSLHMPASSTSQTAQIDEAVVPTSHPNLEACLPAPQIRNPLSRAGSSPQLQPPAAAPEGPELGRSQDPNRTTDSPVKSSQTQYLSLTRRGLCSPLDSIPNSSVASSQTQHLSPVRKDAGATRTLFPNASSLSPSRKEKVASAERSLPVSPVRSSQSPIELFITLPSPRRGSQIPHHSQPASSGLLDCDVSSTPVRGLSFAVRSSSPLPAALGLPSSSPYSTPRRRALQLELEEDDLASSPSAVIDFGTVFEKDEEFSEMLRTSQVLIDTATPLSRRAIRSQDSGSETEDESDEEHSKSLHTTPRAVRITSPTRASQRSPHRRLQGLFGDSQLNKGKAPNVISPTRRVQVSPAKTYAAYTYGTDDTEQSFLGANTQSMMPGMSFPQFSSLPFSLPMFVDVDDEDEGVNET